MKMIELRDEYIDKMPSEDLIRMYQATHFRKGYPSPAELVSYGLPGEWPEDGVGYVNLSSMAHRQLAIRIQAGLPDLSLDAVHRAVYGLIKGTTCEA